MGGLRLSEREGAYTVAPSIQGKQQQTTDDPEFALNDPKGTADDAPQETNMVGRGGRGGNHQNLENQDDDDDERNVLFDNKIHIRWIEAAGCKPIFASRCCHLSGWNT